MTTHARWAEWANPDPLALTEFLEACDRALGNQPIEVTADELSGFAWLAPRMGDGALWLPDGDAAATAAAQAAGFERQYTDIQMTRAVLSVDSREPPPLDFAVADLDATEGSTLRAVHDLICRTWSVNPHWQVFMERFASSAADPSLRVLLTPTLGASAGRLVAATWGRVQPSDEGPLGVVGHLDVDPDHRRQGLGSWALNALVRRFEASNARVRTARLGVHDDNASKAPDLYRRMGWKEVSRHQKWTFLAP